MIILTKSGDFLEKKHLSWEGVLQRATCTILGRHFERVSVPAHVRDKYKILMADREFPVVSGHTRRLPYCYYYLRVLYFANFCDSQKIAKLSTRKNFYQPKRHSGVCTCTITNCMMFSTLEHT